MQNSVGLNFIQYRFSLISYNAHFIQCNFGLISYSTVFILIHAIQLWSYYIQYSFGLITYNTALVLLHAIQLWSYYRALDTAADTWIVNNTFHAIRQGDIIKNKQIKNKTKNRIPHRYIYVFHFRHNRCHGSVACRRQNHLKKIICTKPQ